PLAIVRPLIARSVALPLAWKTRVVLPPLTVTWVAPGPLMVRSFVTVSSLARVMVPFRPGANLMRSAPAVALAAVIAAAREFGPLGSRFLTVKVLGTVRSSSTSRRGTKGRRGATLRRGCRARPRPERPFSQRTHEVNTIDYVSWGKSVCGHRGKHRSRRADQSHTKMPGTGYLFPAVPPGLTRRPLLSLTACCLVGWGTYLSAEEP